jgi:4-hydroxy-4-methyl-2-oxoglutarate aldolase
MNYLTPEQLSAIQQYDTCTVLNAIETFGVRLRNDGFARPGLTWMFPSVNSILGYACTMCVKSSNPPVTGSIFEDRTEWWNDIKSLPGPCIAVVEDIDKAAGFGSVAGDVHVAVMQRLGCIGLVTNGSVRDLASVEKMGFGFYARSVSPSHAYVHMVDHNQPVDIYGLRVHPGDLLYADRNGLISIPPEIATQIPAAAEGQRTKDRRIIDFCRSPGFSLDRLREEVK